ncbi:MAG: radical SAM/SPASM domain-containing protein [Planctomycetota bacterium]
MSTLRRTNTETVRGAEEAGLARYDAYPTRVTLELTADCNLRCPHCEFTPPRAWRDKHDPCRILHVSLEDLTRFAGDVFPHVQEIIPSVIGEPMMYPYWNEFLELLAEHGTFMELVTNGTYLDEETLTRLAPVTSKLIVSMDGASKRTFNYLRHPSDFDDVVSRLAMVQAWREALPMAERPQVVIASVLTLQWVDELPDMVRLAARLGVDELAVGHLIAYSQHWRESQPAVEPERTDRALGAASEEARRLGISVLLPRLFSTGEDVSYRTAASLPLEPKVEQFEAPDNKKYWCKYVWREAWIALDGTVSPCCGTGRPEVGNLRENYDLKKIFMHPTLARMREGMVTGDLHEACARCPQLSMFGQLDYEATDFTNEYSSLKGVIQEQKKQGQ